MNIRKKIAELDIKMNELAKQLDVSRPTLYNYVSTFESGEKISNDKYQLIFERLFSDDVKTKQDFQSILEKYHVMLERDRFLGTLNYSAKKTDLITSIIERMKEDLKNPDYEESVYIFINYLITSYKKEPIFRKYANYILYLNSIKPFESVKDDEKIFISNCFKVMSQEKNGELKFDGEYYDKFIEKAKDIKRKNRNGTKTLNKEIFEEEIKNILDNQIKKQLEMGVSIEEIDKKEIIKKIIQNDDD